MADEPATEILKATYQVLCERGYTDLTLQDIAAEADTSKSSIHYHYDSKDQLFVAFLDELYDRFTSRVRSLDSDTPRERLDALLQSLLVTDADPSLREFRTAMLEIKAQAPYKPALQERLTEFDEYLFERLRAILEAGRSTGDFDDTVEPARDAEFLTTTITGAHTRHVAIDHASDRIYTTMRTYIQRHLLTDEHTEAAQ
ncbi:TetR/AcrR family transcriptional regulator [Halostagnicola kamekurae]|uniref:DNA-binding transcriptional regulator, AcrR family n=1 Tax=Halostagnicola kamekurae TaxID=619731 RepID=A0A1I6U7Y7_9EURY|nr:TetR/AcrR family transcriptional regulator [Halostagnicola kamekurae]SFS97468.1 DNA-binding transcriptional regulator, AcrR family [Halostagnicola kamekurae]